MITVSEITPDMFRISTFVPDFNLQFNQFLVRDDEPLLFHTGPPAMFTDRLEVGSGMSIDLLKRESVGSLLDRASQRMRNRRSA